MKKVLSTEIQAIIGKAYQLFSVFPVPSTFNLCACGYCVDKDYLNELKSIPLKDISREAIYEYINAVVEIEDLNQLGMPYLLPRILELLVLGQYISSCVELTLSKMQDIPPNTLSQQHYELLVNFANQYIEDRLQMTEATQETVILVDILVMFDIGNINVEQILGQLANDIRLWPVISIARLIFDERKNGLIINSFMKENSQLNQMINQWLERSYIELAKNARSAVESYSIGGNKPSYNSYMQDEWLLALCDEKMILNTIS